MFNFYFMIPRSWEAPGLLQIWFICQLSSRNLVGFRAHHVEIHSKVVGQKRMLNKLQQSVFWGTCISQLQVIIFTTSAWTSIGPWPEKTACSNEARWRYVGGIPHPRCQWNNNVLWRAPYKPSQTPLLVGRGYPQEILNKELFVLHKDSVFFGRPTSWFW